MTNSYKVETSTSDLVAETGQYRGTAKKFPQYLAAISICTGSIATGTVLGWTANISVEMSNGQFNDLEIDDSSLGWIGSFATLGAMCMCFPIGFMCDWLGRKLSNLLLIIPFLIGWLLIIFSNSLAMVYAGRFIIGMAGGAFCVSAPLYTSEIAQKEIRGTLGSYFQLFLVIGILYAYVIAKFADIIPYTIACAVIPLVFGVVFVFQPETPVYSLKKGDEVSAKAALRRLRGNTYDVDAELKEMKEAIEHQERTRVPFLQSLKKPNTRKAFLISFGLMFFQQLSGVNAVLFYTSTIIESAGIDLDAKVATIIMGVTQVVATLVASLVIEKLGRKLLLIISDLLMTVSIVLLGVFFMLKDRNLVGEDTLSTLGFLPVLSLCVFIIVFSLGFGPIPWLISSEIYPEEVKSIASSAAGTFNWFLAFLVSRFYLDLRNAIGGDITFYIFGAISLVGTVFVIFVVRETKGKSLQQIQLELGAEPLPNIQTTGIDNKGYDK